MRDADPMALLRRQLGFLHQGRRDVDGDQDGERGERGQHLSGIACRDPAGDRHRRCIQGEPGAPCEQQHDARCAGADISGTEHSLQRLGIVAGQGLGHPVQHAIADAKVSEGKKAQQRGEHHPDAEKFGVERGSGKRHGDEDDDAGAEPPGVAGAGRRDDSQQSRIGGDRQAHREGSAHLHARRMSALKRERSPARAPCRPATPMERATSGSITNQPLSSAAMAAPVFRWQTGKNLQFSPCSQQAGRPPHGARGAVRSKRGIKACAASRTPRAPTFPADSGCGSLRAPAGRAWSGSRPECAACCG